MSELEARIAEQAAEIEELKAEVAEHEASFELRWKADMRAIKRWRAGRADRELTWPDHADLCVNLLDWVEAAERKAEAAEARVAELQSFIDEFRLTHEQMLERAERSRAELQGQYDKLGLSYCVLEGQDQLKAEIIVEERCRLAELQGQLEEARKAMAAIIRRVPLVSPYYEMARAVVDAVRSQGEQQQ